MVFITGLESKLGQRFCIFNQHPVPKAGGWESDSRSVPADFWTDCLLCWGIWRTLEHQPARLRPVDTHSRVSFLASSAAGQWQWQAPSSLDYPQVSAGDYHHPLPGFKLPPKAGKAIKIPNINYRILLLCKYVPVSVRQVAFGELFESQKKFTMPEKKFRENIFKVN